MSAIFFQLNTSQEADLKKLMKETGYTKKSEFFRFLMSYFRLMCAADSLGRTLTELDKQGKLGTRPLEELLMD